MPPPRGDLQRSTTALAAAGNWGRAGLSADRVDYLVVFVISFMVLIAGLSAPFVQRYFPSTAAAHTAASVSVTLNVVALAIIPRGPASKAPYSTLRIVACEVFRAAALLLGLIGSATPLDSEDAYIARWSSALATFFSFVYSRLDDKRKHHWSRHKGDTDASIAPPVSPRRCKVGGATALASFAVVVGFLAAVVQPGIGFVFGAGTLMPLLAYVICVPAIALVFDVYRETELVRYRCLGMFILFVIFGVTLTLAFGLPQSLSTDESTKTLIQQVLTFILCLLSAAGVPVLSALMAFCSRKPNRIVGRHGPELGGLGVASSDSQAAPQAAAPLDDNIEYAPLPGGE